MEKKPLEIYSPSAIRTANMLPYRGNDIDFGDEISLTKQADAAGCDINNIMSQYEASGLLLHVNQLQGQYADLGDGATYQEHMNAVIAAQDAFDTLPAVIRSQFENDPSLFLDFVADEKNRPEMIKMGLIDAPASEEAQPVKAADNTSVIA